ncbi:zinc finger protein 783 [Cuculus canorus]|uniref:zinc finger protein 783 n=1 Tax=Cuculus canorus TaxID=55661 RepID=UPI0023AB4D6F|nr:zinc finger protein 783 [Cuculus canorus]
MSRRGPVQASSTPRRRVAMAPRAAAGLTDAQQLRELQSRTERAERRLLACENLVGELGTKLSAMGSLLQDYGHLQKRLDNVENLLKNRNFWILRLPPSTRGEIPKVPITFDDISVYFNEQEWDRMERWQKDLYRAVIRGNYEMLISLDYAVAKPDVLSQMERDEEFYVQDHQEPLQTRIGDEMSSLQTRSGDETGSLQTQIGDGQESPQTRFQDSQETPQAPEEMEEALGEKEFPEEADTDRAAANPDILSRMERDKELDVRDGLDPPQTHIGDEQEPSQRSIPSTRAPPQTDIPSGAEPLQAPEKMGQREEALRGDKVSPRANTEVPILVMNVVSLSPENEKRRRKDQSEREMEENLSESDTEEAFLPGNETAQEGASPAANIKVKEEEPEALEELSSPSPSLEMQKCPKSEPGKAKSKKKPSRCESSSLLMGNCRRGYVREWSHPCTECGKRFRLKINLIIHQRSHAKEGPYECSTCEISFADKRHLDLHQSIHIKDRAFGAKVWGNVHPDLRIRPRRKLCGASYGGAHSLGNGTCAGGSWLGQPKEEPDRGSLPSACPPRQPSPKPRKRPRQKCNLCQKILSCAFSLQRHLQTHSRDRRYCCAACKKCFTRRTHLLRHEKIHERQKALAELQRPVAATTPTPQGAPATPAGRSVPRSPASERNVSPAATAPKAGPANALPVSPAGLRLSVRNCHIHSSGGRAIQPVVILGNRAAVSWLTEK